MARHAALPWPAAQVGGRERRPAAACTTTAAASNAMGADGGAVRGMCGVCGQAVTSRMPRTNVDGVYHHDNCYYQLLASACGAGGAGAEASIDR